MKALDAMAAPAMASVAVLRLFEYLSSEGRGMQLEEGSFFCRFPFAVMNEYFEWQWAVFLWEETVAILILLILICHHGERGDKALLATVLYCAAQIVLESLRLDSAPKWGFVRVSQVLFAASLLAAGTTCVYRRFPRREAFCRTALVLGCIAGIGILEWAIDKSSVPVWACYLLMCADMGVAVLAARFKKGQAKKRFTNLHFMV